MGKQGGLGDNLFVDGYDLSGDAGAITGISTPVQTLPGTGINKSANERLFGERDGALAFMSYFNDAAGAEHLALSTLPTADRIVTYLRGTTLGNPAASINAKQVNYDGTRGNDGSFTLTVQAVANGFALEWGRQLTAGVRTDGAGANGTGVDFLASSAFGLQAYLQVRAFTGTSVTVKLQESSDNGVGDAWADVVGGAFAAASARGAQRIATATNLTVERYLRVVTTGTFSNAEFVVMVNKNETAPVF